MLLLLLSACTSDEPPEGCTVELKSTWPEDGATDAYHRDAVEFQLSDPDPTATMTASFPGTFARSEDGQTLSITPDEPLDLGTSYSAELSWCGGTSSVSFTTSNDGAPLADPQILVGRTWSFNLTDARIVHPEGLGGMLQNFPAQPILVGVTEVGDGTISMIEAASVQEVTPLTQEYCAPTTTFPTGEFGEQPYFSIAQDSATVSVGGIPVPVTDLAVSGTFSADGTYIAGGKLSAVLDTRPMAPLAGGSDPNTVCSTVISLGIVCEPCPTDGERYCLSLEADHITAPEVPGVLIQPVAGTDCEGCEEGPPAEDAVCAE